VPIYNGHNNKVFQNVVRVSDIINKDNSNTPGQCEIIVAEDTFVHDVLTQISETECEHIGVGSSHENITTVLSRTDLVNSILNELDNNKSQLGDLYCQLESSLLEQTNAIYESLWDHAESEKNKLDMAVDNLNEGLLILDTDGNVRRANPTVKKHLDIDENAGDKEIASALDEYGFRKLVFSNHDMCGKENGNFQIKTTTGKTLDFGWHQMTDELGTYSGNVVTIRDITDSIVAENAKNEFISAISHELRTPLTSIQNSVSNILAGVTGKVSGKTRDYLYTMESDCHRFADVINDLLDMAKIESGSMSIESQVVDLSEMINNSMDAFIEDSREKNIKLSYETDAYIPPVHVDPFRMCQVLDNLISNAVKYTDRGGTVTISTYEKENEIVTLIEDTGVGISRELQNAIFNKFYQIGRQAGAGYKGTGLGLALCQGILQIHAGRIWVESEEGKGSKFYFTIPKINGMTALQKHLEKLVEWGRRKDDAFVLISTEFRDNSDNSEDITEEMQGFIRQYLGRCKQLMSGKDELVIQTGEFQGCLVIKGVENRRIGEVRKKIAKIVKNCLRKWFGHDRISPMIGIAEFPGDSCDPNELLKKARNDSVRMF